VLIIGSLAGPQALLPRKRQSKHPPHDLQRSEAHHAAKADVSRGGIQRLRRSCCRPVSQAILRRAQMRSTLQGLTGRLIVNLWGSRRRWTAAGRCHDVPGLIGRGRPFPHIADRVDEPETIGRERPDRRGADPAGSAGVLVREMALPGIGHQLTARPDLLTQAYVVALPALAAYSHSASPGSLPPAQFAYASAS
jgi:hypothetical protein